MKRQSKKGKEQREAHDKVKNERNNEIKEKFKHWITPMSKQCLGQNCQKETCQGTHPRPWKTTPIQSNLFTQQALKDDNVSLQIQAVGSCISTLINVNASKIVAL